MLTRLFCDIDDFCHDFIPQWEATLLESGQKKRKRTRSVSHSEVITLIVYFHQMGYRTNTARHSFCLTGIQHFNDLN